MDERGGVPKGAIDLIAVYEDNILAGLRKSTQEEFDNRTQERKVDDTILIQEQALESTLSNGGLNSNHSE